MQDNFAAKLWVNNASMELNPFVEQILAGTVAGAISSLKGAETIQTAELHVDHGDVKITVNKKELPLTPFPNDIIANTITGFVSSLKGVDRVESLRISLKAHRAKG